MAKRSFSCAGTTFTAVADTANMTNNGYMLITGGAATQLVNVMEVYIGGLANASTISQFLLARDSTPAATTAALASPFADGPMLNSATALGTPAIALTSFTTVPQRSASTSLNRLNLSLNTFGGIVKWTAAPGEEWQILGSLTASVETTLSCSSAIGGNSIAGTHLIYEPFVFAICAVTSALAMLSGLLC